AWSSSSLEKLRCKRAVHAAACTSRIVACRRGPPAPDVASAPRLLPNHGPSLAVKRVNSKSSRSWHDWRTLPGGSSAGKEVSRDETDSDRSAGRGDAPVPRRHRICPDGLGPDGSRRDGTPDGLGSWGRLWLSGIWGRRTGGGDAGDRGAGQRAGPAVRG